MSKTLHVVEPFEYTYSVTNVYDDFDSIPRYFSSLSAVKNYILSMVRDRYSGYYIGAEHLTVYDLVNETGIKYRNNWKKTDYETEKWWNARTTFVEDSFPFLIRNNYGAIITAKEVARAPEYVHPPYTGRYWSRPAKWTAQTEARLTNKKNAAKIKEFHKVERRVSDVRGQGEEELEQVCWWWTRSPRTSGELRATEGHNTEDEDGFKFGRAKRNRRHIRTVWDDVPVAAKRSEVSWKTNSKRRKQWKPKGE